LGTDLKALLKEVKDIRSSVEKLENIIEQRLLGKEEPLEDEKQAIKEYIKNKSKNQLELMPLGDTMNQLGIQRTNRKKSH